MGTKKVRNCIENVDNRLYSLAWQAFLGTLSYLECLKRSTTVITTVLVILL